MKGVTELRPLLAVPDSAWAQDTRPTFDELYARRFRPLVALALVLLDSREQAEEAVQEAFARLWPRVDRVDEPEAYVRTCVLNECRAVLRRRRLTSRSHIAIEAVLAPPDPLDDALRRLPPTRRAVVVCRYYLGMSVEEIASSLGLRVGTVKSRLHRALGTLRKEIER